MSDMVKSVDYTCLTQTFLLQVYHSEGPGPVVQN